jgi:hypothetical protein
VQRDNGSELARHHYAEQRSAERLSNPRGPLSRIRHAFRNRLRAPPEAPAGAWLEPILVDYAARAGSTLIMRLLATSPEIAVEPPYPYEKKYFAYLLRWSRLLDRGDWPSDRWSGADLGSLAQEDRGALLGPPPWPNRPSFEPPVGEPPMSARCFELVWREFSRRAIGATRAQHEAPAANVRYYAEKHLHTWKVNRAEMPGFRQLIVVRDPRDTFLSIAAFNEKRAGSPAIGQRAHESRQAWRRRFLRTQKQRLRWIAVVIAEGEIPVLRYEDLVRDLPGQAKRLEDWLSVTLLPEIVVADTKLWTEHATSESPEKSLGRWRTEMEPAEARLFKNRLGDELRAIGFEA